MREGFIKEQKHIRKEFNEHRITTNNKLRELYSKAGDFLCDYFVTNGFVRDGNFCYDPKTNLAFSINKAFIDVSLSMNVCIIDIYYKGGDEYLCYNLKSLNYRFEIEDPCKVFDRFKKHNTKYGISKIKEFCKKYPEMVSILMDEKLEELTK